MKENKNSSYSNETRGSIYIEIRNGLKTLYHKVECTRFCVALMDNNKYVYFIEYYDYDEYRDFDLPEMYHIVEKVDGKWYLKDNNIPYQTLASRVIKELPISELGSNLYYSLYSYDDYNDDYSQSR